MIWDRTGSQCKRFGRLQPLGYTKSWLVRKTLWHVYRIDILITRKHKVLNILEVHVHATMRNILSPTTCVCDWPAVKPFHHGSTWHICGCNFNCSVMHDGRHVNRPEETMHYEASSRYNKLNTQQIIHNCDSCHLFNYTAHFLYAKGRSRDRVGTE